MNCPDGERACHVCSEYPDGQDGECGACGRMIADAAPTESVVEYRLRNCSTPYLAAMLEEAATGIEERPQDMAIFHADVIREAIRRLRTTRTEADSEVLRRLLLIPPMGEADFEQALMVGAAKLRDSDHPRADDWADMLSDLRARIVAALDEEGD